MTRLRSKRTQSIKIKLYTVRNFLTFNNLHSEIFCQFQRVPACSAFYNPSQHLHFTLLLTEVTWTRRSSSARISITYDSGVGFLSYSTSAYRDPPKARPKKLFLSFFVPCGIRDSRGRVPPRDPSTDFPLGYSPSPDARSARSAELLAHCSALRRSPSPAEPRQSPPAPAPCQAKTPPGRVPSPAFESLTGGVFPPPELYSPRTALLPKSVLN